MSGEAVANGGTAVGLLAGLVPLMLYLARPPGHRLGGDRAELRGDVAEVRCDLHAEATAIRADVHVLAERVARIEGTLSGP